MKTKKIGLLVLSVLFAVGLAAQAAVPVADGQGEGAVGAGVKESQSSAAKNLTGTVISPRQFNVESYAVLLPLRTNAGWFAASAAVTDEVVNTRSLSNAISHRLETWMFTQPTARNTNTLWGVARFTGIDGAKINVDMLRVRQMSSDRGNIMTNWYSLVGGNFDYSPQVQGINWNGAGQFASRTNHSIQTSGDGSAMKDEIVIAFVQFPYLVASSAAQYAEYNDYVIRENMAITTVFEVVGNNGDILGSAYKVLSVSGFPIPRHLHIARLSEGRVRITSDLPAGSERTLSILRSSFANGPWHNFRTMNSGEEVTVSGGTFFFRGVLQ